MISPRSLYYPRRGMTLLEVLVALGIFLISLVGIIKLVTLGGEHARLAQLNAQAAQLCQSKLAEVVAGVVPLSSQSEVPFDEDPDWLWSLDANQGDIAGLWKLTVRVTRQQSDGSHIECSLDRMLLDPSLRGSTLDAQNLAANSANNSSSNSQGTSGSSGSTSSSSSGGGGTSGGSGGAAPSSSGAATSKSGTSSPASSSSGSKGTTKGGN
jgi:type II secretion system protein I